MCASTLFPSGAAGDADIHADLHIKEYAEGPSCNTVIYAGCFSIESRTAMKFVISNLQARRLGP